jgi:hypothetical protein
VHASVAEIDRFNMNRDVGDGAYRARLEFMRPVAKMSVGVRREQEVLVENLGDEHWPCGLDGEPPIRLGYRWTRAHGGEVVAEGPRTAFTETVAPGQRSIVKLVIDAPEEPGAYVLEADVVHEHVRWFGCEVRLEVHAQQSDGRGRRQPSRDGGLTAAAGSSPGNAEAARRRPLRRGIARLLRSLDR